MIFQKRYSFGGSNRAALPLFKSGGTAIGKQLFHTGIDLLSDIPHGNNIKVPAEWRFKKGVKNVTDYVAIKVKSCNWIRPKKF